MEKIAIITPQDEGLTDYCRSPGKWVQNQCACMYMLYTKKV